LLWSISETAAPDHHRVGAFDLDLVAVEDFHGAQWGAGGEGRRAEQQLARRARVQRVDVLRGVDRGGDRVCGDSLGQRQLHENSVDRVVAIQLFDDQENILLGGRCGQVAFDRLHTHLAAGALLALDVGSARGIVADQNHREARRPLSCCGVMTHLFGELLANVLCERESVYDDSLLSLIFHWCAVSAKKKEGASITSSGV